jgi:hypothetical protein
MLDITNCNIEKLSIHLVGNKGNGDELILSKTPPDISDERLRELLGMYFLQSFNNPEFYSFTFTNKDFSLNPLFTFATQVFDDGEAFHRNSRNIAKHLYEISMHPQIKSGDLFVSYITDVVINGEAVDAIGIFKSENRQSFLKVDNESDFALNYDDGISIDKPDKGCLILNTDRDNGLRVCIIDKSNKGGEAQYWRDTFLLLAPVNDDFHATKSYLDVCRTFVTDKLETEYEVNKADKIDFLNKTVDYFKNNETFEEDEFLNTVFQDKSVIQSFNNFKNEYASAKEVEFDDSFSISSNAVKKQARVFKSVLKLDKNFHVYIHGDKDLIEKGYDEKVGKHFYKIYFDQEA